MSSDYPPLISSTFRLVWFRYQNMNQYLCFYCVWYTVIDNPICTEDCVISYRKRIVLLMTGQTQKPANYKILDSSLASHFS